MRDEGVETHNVLFVRAAGAQDLQHVAEGKPRLGLGTLRNRAVRLYPKRARREDDLRLFCHDRAMRVARKGWVESVLRDCHRGMTSCDGAGCRNRWAELGGMRRRRVGRNALANPA